MLAFVTIYLPIVKAMQEQQTMIEELKKKGNKKQKIVTQNIYPLKDNCKFQLSVSKSSFNVDRVFLFKLDLAIEL
jgi:hypothetical protein